MTEKEIINAMVECGFCGKKVHSWEVGLSRKDNRTDICSQCATDEAMKEYEQNFLNK